MFSIFHSIKSVPLQYRRNFYNLYFDMAWFGVLTGSTLAFLAVYCTRLGGQAWQIGLLNAIPAVVNLAFTFPAGAWIGTMPTWKAVFLSSVVNRMFYGVAILLPVLIAPEIQIWVIIGVTFFMSIPATAFAVGTNSLIGEVVPAEWRAHVVGVRNAMFSLLSMVTLWICSAILKNFSFQTGYQVVFGIGFVGAMLSCVHLFFVRPISSAFPEENRKTGMKTPVLQKNGFSLELLRGPFARVLLLLFFMHFAQYLIIAIVPTYQVNYLKYSDEIIGWGNSINYLTYFLVSTQVEKAVRRFGNHKFASFSAMAMCVWPVLFSVSWNPIFYLFTMGVGGFVWALVTCSILNYLLERVPEENRSGHLSWYNLVFNGGILAGSLSGPFIAGGVGFQTALFLFAAIRLLAGLLIWRWG